MTDPTPTNDDLTTQLRDWPTSDSGHIADQRGFCQVCSLRMPCDWAQILDDVSEAADEIERLNAVAYEAALMAGWNDKTIREAGLRDPDGDEVVW